MVFLIILLIAFSVGFGLIKKVFEASKVNLYEGLSEDDSINLII